MNVHDLLSRSDAICKQYDKYLEQPKEPKVDSRRKNMDAFELQFDQLETRVIDLEEQAKATSKIRDRTQVAEKNAAVRRGKAALLTDIVGLQKQVPKMKGTKEQVLERTEQVNALEQRADDVADGMNIVRKKPGTQTKRTGLFGAPKGPALNVQMDAEEMKQLSDNPSYYDTTDENRAFEAEFQARKEKQDLVLDDIELGLGNLKNIAQDMGAEMQKQDILIDEIDENMDKARKNITTNNAKLAGVLHKVSGQRNFCINIILISVLLAVAAFIYTQVT